MAVSTLETLSVDGVVLNTFAWNLQTLTGRQSTPPVVGENRRVVGRPGASWERKEFGERQEVWSMWVAGCDDDGLFPSGVSSRQTFNENLDQLKRLFGVRHRQLVLEKRLMFPDGVRVFSALGECVDTIEPQSMMGGTRATFSAAIRLADPFWYLPEVGAVVDEAGAEVVNPGSAVAQRMMLSFDGPLTFPQLTCVQTGVSVRLSGAIGSGDSVVLDTDLFTAVDSASQNRISTVSQFGSDWWMELLPGVNDLTLENSNGGSVGAGSVTMLFRPPNL